MRKIILLFLSCWVFTAAASAFGADQTANPAKAELGTIKPANAKESYYKICVGDILNVQVYQESDLSGDFEVKEDGTISYPLLGTVKVAGLTTTHVENTLYELLEKDYLVKPFVRLTIKKYKQLEGSVMLLGAVQKPGSYILPQDKPTTLLQAIALAGGFTASASVDGISILRNAPEGKKTVIDPQMSKIFSGEKKDIELQSNDLIKIPDLNKSEKRITVMVMGAVHRPGSYTHTEDKPFTLLNAISLAGGLTASASVNKITVVRTGANGLKETLSTGVKDILAGKKKDVELQSDDLISVPERLF